jgi:hypothetical protein
MTRLLLPPSLLTLIFTSLSHLPVSSAAGTDYTISSFDSNQRPASLSTACNTIYTAPIPSCQPFDFTPVNLCSAACISSLQQLQSQAQAACMGQTVPQQSMLRYFRDGQGVIELCTTQKQVSSGGVAVTFATSVIPAATTVPSLTSSTTAAAQTSGIGEQQTSGMLALSKPALLAVVISIFIAFAIFFIIAVMMYRKHYRK